MSWPRGGSKLLTSTQHAAEKVLAAAIETDPRRTLGPTRRPVPSFPDPEPLSEHGPARIVAVCNQKGGVGKTTTTINLGAALAEQGRRVLLVDFDPQGALSVGLGQGDPRQLELTVHNLLLERGTEWEDILLETTVEGMDLLPSNIDLSGAEVQLVHEVGREYILQQCLKPAVEHYDYILIDCQPSLGLLTINALAASDGVLVPLECEYFAMRGVALLMETIEKVQGRVNPELVIDGFLGTMYDSRTLHTREVLSRVVEAFGDKVFHTVINRTVRFPDATVVGEPITTFDSSSMGANAYRELAKEVLERWRLMG
jgi:chromosome partitioning protein